MASHYINPQDIWDLFYTIFDGNEYACAGAMGNMQAESGLYSDNAENLWNELTGHSDEWLTERINNGTISEAEFLQRAWYVNAYGFGYGLSQWTTETRRKLLWDYTIDQGRDIDSQQAQFEYITWEWLDEDSPYHEYLQGMKDCNSIYSATRYYCRYYEGGSWNSDRLRFAVDWYDTFAGQPTADYYIYVDVTGNGEANVVPARANAGEQIELNIYPASGETLEALDARGVTTGQSIALDFRTGTQYFPMPNESVNISIVFSGTPPVPPVTHNKMPLYLMLRQRR